MKIAIVVHGRFHAFDLAKALLERGQDVAVFTNYPKWAAVRFALPRQRVRSFWLHGFLSRAIPKVCTKRPGAYESWLHRMFGRWARSALRGQHWDVVHLWSSIAEEMLRTSGELASVCLLTRGSAHIRTQARLLVEEEKRTGSRLDKPSPWMISREEREYSLADAIVVLSTFAHNSFVDEGVPRKKLKLLPLAAQPDMFRPKRDVVEARCRRILSGEPLRLLYVGALSFQKGLWDLGVAAQELGNEGFQFRLVGPPVRETAGFVSGLHEYANFTKKRPQSKLPAEYAWADVFVFPTIQDGYAQVLSQAAASALPILTTTNCSGPDFIREGENGWVVPIRSPDRLVERLRWCASHRRELAAMVQRIYESYRPRNWDDVAKDYEALCQAALEAKGLTAAGSMTL